MKTILIVDDEFGLAEILCDLLAFKGYRAEKAWNGQLALKMVAQHRPDLIVSDVMMPIMDGCELLRALKAAPETRSIPVVLMSAATTLRPEDLAGTAGFLAKPFEIAELLALVKSLIGPDDAEPSP